MGTTISVPIVHRYSMLAQRMRPWERWQDPKRVSKHSVLTVDADGSAYLDVKPPLPKARYFGLTVKVVARMTQLSVIEWAGHKMMVETADLEVGQ